MRSTCDRATRPGAAVLLRAIIAIPFLLLSGADLAWGQSNPSSDEIINSLRPSGAVSGLTRGIRPAGPAAAPVAPAPVAPANVSPPANPADAAVSATHAAAVAASSHRVAPPAHNDAVVTGESGAPSVNLTVMFATGSAQLTQVATRTLDELGRALSSSTLAGYKFRIEGHTDTVGGAVMNKALSEQRANAVVDYLVTRFNIDRARLIPVGMGQDGLLIQTPPETPEPRNRRVQVVNVGA